MAAAFKPGSPTVDTRAVRPLVSILIPHYNYIQFVPTAIDSALAQTYPNFEVVVTDNCSTDGAVPFLRERYRDEPRVRIIENERNLGMTGNFNRALEHARGEYILWMSSDDFMLPAHIDRLQAVFEREPQIDVVYSGVYFADQAGRIFNVRALPGQFPVDYVDARDELVEELTTVCPVCLPSALFRRALIDEMGPMDDDEYMAADWEYLIRIAAAGKRFAYLADPSVCVRIHQHQRSGTEYHVSGRNLTDFVAYVTKFLNHEGWRRMRGRELTVLRLIDTMHSDVIRRNDSKNPFSPEAEARFNRLRQVLQERAGDPRPPASVRSCKISVIVQASGQPQDVLGAIESIADQTFPNVEIVVVDHGPFPFEHILRAHRAWDRMRYLRQRLALTPGAAFNFGLRMASGEYIAFLDFCNRFAPDHLAALADTIERSGAEVAASRSRLVIDRSLPGFGNFERLAEADIFLEENDPPELALVASALPLDAIMYYRGVNQRVGTFNETLPALADFEFLVRLQRNGRIVWTGSQTLFVHARLGLVEQPLLPQLSFYLPVLDAFYKGHPVSDPLTRLREVHRSAVEQAITTVKDRVATAQGVGEFLATLAGRAVFQVPAATAPA